MNRKIKGLLRNQQGTIIGPVAIIMIAFVAVLALIIDLGHLQSVRQELQNAAEAGALAGARALFPLRPQVPLPTGVPYCSAGLQAASDAAARNKSDGDSVTVLAADAQLIRWDWKNNKLNPLNPSCSQDPNTGVNGITVTTRRSSAVPAGAVFLTVGKIFGMDTMDVAASATAAMGYVTGLPPGPFNNIAINQAYLNSIQNQTGDILMSPDQADNGAWAAPSPYGVNAANLQTWISTDTSPGVPATNTVNLLNGVAASVYHALQTALTQNSQNYGGVTGWLVELPVVDTSKFVGSAPIITFQPIIITSIKSTGNPKGINFRLYNGPVTLPGTNPGGAASLVYTLPKLVQIPLPSSN